MKSHLDTHALRIVQLDKLKELQAQENNLKRLQGELARINLKIKNKDALSPDDVTYLGQLGWLAALSASAVKSKSRAGFIRQPESSSIS